MMNAIPRPPFQLRSLPIPIRWEVTRRNPYFYIWWKLARAEHRREVIASPEDALLRQVAVVTLGMIGVSGEPPDPATPFSELGADDLERGWLSGAVHPVTMRGLAAILLAALPKETLGQLGHTFLTAACDDVEDRPPKSIEAMQQLTEYTWPGLDGYPDEPFVSINPAASERSISKAIDQLIKEWKEQRNLDERRPRIDKYDEYLQVWDFREGWRDGIYDRGAELTFREIAEKTKRSPATLNNQYCRAFELITGSPYSRELWLQMFGPIKISELAEAGIARTRRPTTSPTPRPVPDSVVSPVSQEKSDTSLISKRVAGNNNAGFGELLEDITSVLKAGRSDAQIREELDLWKLSEEDFAYIRQRRDASSHQS